MTDLDCYDPKPVPQAVAKAPVAAHPRPPVAKRRVARKPLYVADKKADEVYPCDSPSLPPLALGPIEPEPPAEFTPIPVLFVEPMFSTLSETPDLDAPSGTPSFSGYPSFGGGGYVFATSPIPEPSTLWLVGAGLLALRRRRCLPR